MNNSYLGQNINYKNIINNTININSPNSSNFYYNFKTENISKSPEVNYRNFENNNKLTNYQSIYNNLNFEIPNKLIIPNTNRSFILSSKRVYSKPKVPKYKMNKSKMNTLDNYDSLNDNDNYYTLQNINNNKIRNDFYLNNDDNNPIELRKKIRNAPIYKNENNNIYYHKSPTAYGQNFLRNFRIRNKKKSQSYSYDYENTENIINKYNNKTNRSYQNVNDFILEIKK